LEILQTIISLNAVDMVDHISLRYWTVGGFPDEDVFEAALSLSYGKREISEGVDVACAPFSTKAAHRSRIAIFPPTCVVHDAVAGPHCLLLASLNLTGTGGTLPGLGLSHRPELPLALGVHATERAITGWLLAALNAADTTGERLVLSLELLQYADCFRSPVMQSTQPSRMGITVATRDFACGHSSPPDEMNCCTTFIVTRSV
jgi:hypothetical protein